MVCKAIANECSCMRWSKWKFVEVPGGQASSGCNSGQKEEGCVGAGVWQALELGLGGELSGTQRFPVP